MIERDFYPLAELARRWRCAIADLLHLGYQDRAQVCVNVYGMARELRMTRMDTDIPDEDDLEHWALPESIQERAEAGALNEAYMQWKLRTTREMPHGIYELNRDTLRFMEMPDAFPYELCEALKFDDYGWWDCEFGKPVTVGVQHLCMLREEVLRLDRGLFSHSKAVEPNDLERYEASYSGDKLMPILNLWEPAARALGVTLKQGAEFVEKQILGRQMIMFADDEHTGRWHSIETPKVENALLDMWNSGEAHAWSFSSIKDQGWLYLRVAPADASRVIAEARRIGRAEPDFLEDAPKEDFVSSNNATSTWPWGSHSTELLRHLAAAAQRWWVNVDPSDNTTAPTNIEVTEWLQQRGVAKRTAETMATILRANGLPTGPRT